MKTQVDGHREMRESLDNAGSQLAEARAALNKVRAESSEVNRRCAQVMGQKEQSVKLLIDLAAAGDLYAELELVKLRQLLQLIV